MCRVPVYYEARSVLKECHFIAKIEAPLKPERCRSKKSSEIHELLGDANARDGPLISKTTNKALRNTSPRICNELPWLDWMPP